MAGQPISIPFPRGKTAFTTADATSGEGYLGTRYAWEDRSPTATTGAATNRSNTQVVLQAVRNVAAIALLPRRLVKYKAAKRDKEVDGYTCLTSADFAGVVDEFLPTAGAAVNAVFYIVKSGYTTVLTDLAASAANLITEGDNLCTLTAATSGATTAGRVSVVDWTGSTAAQCAQVRNARIRALSANTTNQTNRELLVEVTYW